MNNVNRGGNTKHRRNPKRDQNYIIFQKLIIYTDHKNLTCKNFNTNILLRCILILGEYGPDIEYIKGEKNILADTLSILPPNMNQDTTQKSNYQKEIVSEINDIEELS